MSCGFFVVSDPARTLFGTLTQVTAGGAPGLQWNVTGSTWGSGVAVADRKITLTEGASPDLGRYTGGTSTLGSYTGLVLKQIHDDNDNDRVIGGELIYLLSGVEQRDTVLTDTSTMPTAVWASGTRTLTAATNLTSTGGSIPITGGGLVSADMTAVSTDTAAADNLETCLDGTGGTFKATITGNVVGTVSTVTTTTSVTNGVTLATGAITAAAIATDAIDSDAVAASAVTKIQAGLGTSANQTTIIGYVDELESRLSSGRATNLDNLNATISSRMAAASYTAPDNANILVAATQSTNAATDAATAISRLTSARAGYLDKLNITGNVSSQASVDVVQNCIRTKFIGVDQIEIPAAGSTVLRFNLLILDTAGNMEAPDSLPVVTAANQAGTDRSGNLGSVTLVSTGHYYVDYTVSSAHLAEQISLLVTVVEGGVTIRDVATFAVVLLGSGSAFSSADRSKLDAIHLKLPSKAYLTGTAAADGDINLDQCDGSRDPFKADVSGLTAGQATIIGYVDDLETRLSATRAGYLDRLDAAISTRLATAGYTAPDNSGITTAAAQATTAATQATTAATQSTTAAGHGATLVSRLTSQRATNLDNLDAQVSTRSTFATLSDTVTLKPGQDIATSTQAVAIKAKTDLIPASPAAVTDIPTASQNASQVDATLTAAHGSGSWSQKSDATLAKQDAILAAIAGIAPSPPSAAIVSSNRVWRILKSADGATASNIIQLNSGTTATLEMDFSQVLNPQTSVANVTSAVDASGNGLSLTNAVVAQSRVAAHVDVTTIPAGRYRVRITIATTDTQTFVGEGWIEAA